MHESQHHPMDATRDLPALRVLVSRLGFDYATALHRLRRNEVSVVSGVSKELSAHLAVLERLFEQSGIPMRSEGELVVLPMASYLSPEHGILIRDLLERGKRVLLCKPFAAEGWIGPLLHPGGVCWDCVAHRIGLHYPHLSYLQQQVPDDAPISEPPGFSAASLATVFSTIVAHVTRLILDEARSSLATSIISIGAAGAHRTHSLHHVTPWCTTCRGQHAAHRPVPPDIDLTLRLDAPDATDPTAVLEAAYERVEPLISPVTGIVSALTLLRATNAPA